jgi:AAA+ ATPase superfamily predicted ATPase
MGFINRKKELQFLEDKWTEQRSQFIVLWGKRRVGKTELVKQFMQDKPHLYFLSENTNEHEQLKRFSTTIGQFFREPLLETRGFAAWEESFKYIKDKGQKFVLTIDEFPYLIESNKAIPSLFQKAWDEYWSNENICLILLGSSITMMETEVLGYKSPLYGRRTGQWKVDPMSFASVSSFREGKSFEDRLMHYAVAGGIPAYWLQFSQNKAFLSNLAEHVLKKGQVLYEEVEFLLREELREPRYYFALLQAIAQGKRKLSEIVNATGLPSPTANKYLGVLADLHLVEKELPITEEIPLKSKKGLYRISDEFCQFWFKHIFPRKGELEIDMIDFVLEDIKNDLPQYLSFIYEKIAKECLLKHSANIFPFSKIGRWWAKNEEIDIVGFNPSLNKILFAEVKWTTKPVGIDIYESLKEKAKNVVWGNKDRKEYYCLFSKAGFTDAMLEKAKQEKVYLFKGEEFLS